MPDEYLPLLVFPEKRILQPEKGNGFPPGKQNLPGHGAQVDRIGRQIEHLEEDFASRSLGVWTTSDKPLKQLAWSG